MVPPYKLIDQATGHTALGPNGEAWEYMDVQPGHTLELFDTTPSDPPGAPWSRVSPSAIVRPGDEPPPIDPPPIDPLPPSEYAMDYPTNEAQLRDCLMTYASANYVGMLDPRVNIETSAPIVIPAANSGSPWGVNGNYAKVTYRGSGDDVIRIEGVQGVNSRGLTIRNLVLDGGDGGNMSGGGAAACLRVTAPLGDNGPVYRFGIMDVFTSGSVNGLILEGGVYEGEMKNIHIENCTGDGIILRHLPQTPEGKAPVVSNVLMIHINSSRNYGCGLRTVYSVYLVGGSFVLNGGGGVVAPDGIRGAIMCNGENTGGAAQAVFDVPSNGYGSYIEMGEASSDGATVCRKWNGSAWEDVGQPLLYYIAMGDGVHEAQNHVSYYGGGTNPMRVVK